MKAFRLLLFLVIGCGPVVGTGGNGDDEDTSTAEAPGCLPPETHGELIAEHESGLRVYASCEGGYLIEHPGEDIVVTDEGIAAIRNASVSDLLEVPGWFSAGRSPCCPTDHDTTCISLEVQRKIPSVFPSPFVTNPIL